MLHTGDVLFDQLLAVIVGVMLFFSPDAVRAWKCA